MTTFRLIRTEMIGLESSLAHILLLLHILQLPYFQGSWTVKFEHVSNVIKNKLYGSEGY